MGASDLKKVLLIHRNLLNLCVPTYSKILYDSAALFLTHDSLTTLDYRSVRQKFLHTGTHIIIPSASIGIRRTSFFSL